MTNYVYRYFINFSLQLFLMEFIFTGQLIKRQHFVQKAVAIFVTYFAGGYFLILVVKRIPDMWYPVSIVYYIGLFLVSMLILLILFEIKWKDALFIGTAGYALQHITYSFLSLTHYLCQKTGGNIAAIDEIIRSKSYVLLYVPIAVAVYFLLAKPSAYRGQIQSVNVKMILLSLCVLLISSVLSVFAEALDIGNGPLLNVICRLYAIVSCLLGLTVQFDISRQNNLEMNNTILEQLLHQERHQHEVSKENIMLINMKCHDLKHQIRELEKVDNRDMRTRLIEEMNENIMIYDSNVKSGNDTIDLILTEKSLICQKEQIKFSYIIDGAKLDFIEVADMYVLFGNALDNAIEGVKREAPELRIISLNIMQKNQMISIHLENYCSDKITFVEEFPETSKGNKAYHGFGTKSIKYLVEKYHGFVEMRQEDGKFILEILFTAKN